MTTLHGYIVKSALFPIPEIIDRIHRIEGISSGKIGQTQSGSLNLWKTSKPTGKN